MRMPVGTLFLGDFFLEVGFTFFGTCDKTPPHPIACEPFLLSFKLVLHLRKTVIPGSECAFQIRIFFFSFGFSGRCAEHFAFPLSFRVSFLRWDNQDCTQYPKGSHTISLYEDMIRCAVLSSVPFLTIPGIGFAGWANLSVELSATVPKSFFLVIPCAQNLSGGSRTWKDSLKCNYWLDSRD